MPPIVALYVLWMLWFLSWMAAALSSSRSDTKLTTAQNIVYSIVVIIAGLLMFGVTPAPGWDVQYRLWPSPKEELGWLAVALAFIAFCIAWWAMICRSFHRSGPLVSIGPYKVVRHPIYASLIIASFATATVFGRPSSLTGAVALLLAFVLRIVIEEHAMRDESADYDEYADRVPMLAPFRTHRDVPLQHAEASVASPVFDATTAPEQLNVAAVEAVPVEFAPGKEPVAEHLAEAIEPMVDAADELAVDEPAPKAGTVTTKSIQLSFALDDPEVDDVLEDADPVISGETAKPSNTSSV